MLHLKLHLKINGSHYDQTDGVAMGSPVAPVLTNLFMSHHERTWLSNYKKSTALFYRRYVDDIFCMFCNEHDALLFIDFLKQQHHNIKFTYGKESNNQISFGSQDRTMNLLPRFSIRKLTRVFS